MLTRLLRPVMKRLVDPLARALLAAGVSPDVVTLLGTLGTVLSAVLLLPGGHFLAGPLAVTAFVLTDVLDGTMARRLGTTSVFGAWLDSTCDRGADAAVFGSLALWYSGRGDDRALEAVCLYVLATSLLVSYAKARAEGLGMTCNVGVAERTERLVLALGAVLAVGLGLPDVLLAIALVLLAALTTITVGQRALEVRRQASLAA